ncbi:MAG: 50S ribosomal protein L4 [bacterium]|nr:50S ribosomal protein L4 [bacterium]
MKVNETYQFNKDLFKVEVSPVLLAQAVRVYQANQRQGNQSTLTRGDVKGTTRKMYKQKGTGHARHGDAKAPIFVGGGVAHGPHPKDFSLILPQKMRILALKGALTLKLKDKKITAVSGLDKLTGKTKELADFIKEKNVLVVTNKMIPNVVRAAKNLQGIRVLPFSDLNAYEVLKVQTILWDDKIK